MNYELMDKMRKFVSPKAGHKVLESPNKIFGVPLDELMRQTPREGTAVPAAVSRICEHLYKHGVNQEGIFRVSGSARVVEKLKASFNTSGDADLNAEPDIMAVGGLLKLFLRELPDSLIPEHLTQEFIAIETGKSSDQDYILRLRSRLHSLPEENFGLLKYIVCFLVAVSEQQDINKMGPMALSIVFGPNIFRCGDGIAGLKDQGTINVIVSQFITKYDQLFKEDEELHPAETWKMRIRKTPPPRPPPPQVSTAGTSSTTTANHRPVPSPRKLLNQYDSSNYQDGEANEADDDDGSEAAVNNAHAEHSPHFSDEESHGRVSPFVLESESHSIIESPMVTARTSELVERTIYDTITERLFGSEMGSARASPSFGKRSDGSSEIKLDELASSVRAKVEMYERRNSLSEDSKSSASDSAPKAGLTATNAKNVKVNGDERGGGDYVRRNSFDETFDEVERDSELLGSVKKTSGPMRRSPSAKFRRNSLEKEEKKEVDAELTDLLEETAIVVSGGNFQMHKWSKKSGSPSKQDALDGTELAEDINHNRQYKKFSMEFLNLHENQENQPHGLGGLPSPERSPQSGHKPVIPPLDLSILHEHVEASVPILASNTQGGVWDKKLKPPPEEGSGVPSPRVNKLKKRNGVANNTDIPPSPPKHQDQYQKQNLDDDYSHRLKQLTKRIQGLKKRIKTFEEEFENDHGYRPSQGEKAARPEIKKAMSELSRTRKDLKRLREECERGNRSRHGSGASSSGEGADYPLVEDTLLVIQVTLKEKRQDAGRPEDLTLMSRDQVQEEKLAIQKSLLHFEGLHGRPTSKEDKDLMRPLYDRYRAIKRMLAKPMSPRNSLELPTVPEDQMIEIPSGGAASAALFRNAIRVPTGGDGDEEEDQLGTLDFAVTRDFTLMKNITFPGGGGNQGDVLPKVRKKDPEPEPDQVASSESNLHEMSILELHEELEVSKGEKKRLRHHLRDFEKRFHEKHGRKVQKEDRTPMQDSYMQYKQVKARLRLLEALVLKHHE